MVLSTFPPVGAENPSLRISRDPISQLLDPLGGARFSEIYAQHAHVIDLVIYLIFFTGVARVTLSKQFPGAGGRLLSLALGIILSVALVITQSRMHFNIASFGPFAAILLITLAGMMFFQLLQSFGFSMKISGSIAYIAIYATLRAFVPSLFDWLIVHLPFLAGVMTIALIIAMGTLIFSIAPQSHPTGSSWKQPALDLAPGITPQIQDSVNRSFKSSELADEIHITEKDLFKRLNHIKKALPAAMQTESGQTQLLRVLSEIHLEDNAVLQKYTRLKELDQAIQNQDVQTFQQLMGVMKKIPKASIPAVLKSLESVRRRLNLEKTILLLDKRIEQAMSRLSQLIVILAQAIQRCDAASAQNALEAALQMETILSRTLEPASRLEHKLKQEFLRTTKSYPRSSVNSRQRP